MKKYYRSYIERECKFCNEKFEVRKDSNTNCCSNSCGQKLSFKENPLRKQKARNNMLGKILSEETKFKITLSKKGKIPRNLKYIHELRTLDYGECAFNKLVRDLKGRANKRRWVFNLTNERIRELTSSNCKYCGCEPSQIKNMGVKQNINGDYIYNGLDRVDSNLGYIEGNVVPCCKVCNYAKRKMSLFEFVNWINRVHNNLHQKKIYEIDTIGSREEVVK